MKNLPDNQIAKKAVIYCRVSTKEQVDEGNSLVTQEKACREYAVKNSYEISEVFIEQGESAKTINRKELAMLLAYCSQKKNQVNAVICYKLDRISRNTDDYSAIRIALKRNSIEIKSTSETFEDTPAGRFMENIIANVAQFDNDVRAERCRGGMEEALEEGRYVWKAPVGYDNVKVGGKSTIASNPVMAPIINELFWKIAHGLSNFEEIRQEMTQKGLVNPSGKPFAKSYFYSLLRNRLYMGQIYMFGKKYTGLYEPIVSEGLFQQVQMALKRRKHKYYQYNTFNSDFPLRKFVRHPNGQKLTGSWSQGRKARFAYYRFLGGNGNFNRDKLHATFIQFFDRFRLKESHYLGFRELIDKYYLGKVRDENKTNIQAQQEIIKIEEEIANLLKKHDKGLIGDMALQIADKRLSDALVKAKAKLTMTREFRVNILEILERIKEFIKSPGKTWERLGYEAKLKFQWFVFPQGLAYEKENFRTTEICSVFKLITVFLSPLSSWVNLGSIASDTPEASPISPEDVNWDEIVESIVELDKILHEDPP